MSGKTADGGATPVREEAAEALRALAEAISANRIDEGELIDRITALQLLLERGDPLTAAPESEALGDTVRTVSRMLERSMVSSGKVRRSLVRVMRADGASIPAIAQTFGVTHQRISNILR